MEFLTRDMIDFMGGVPDDFVMPGKTEETATPLVDMPVEFTHPVQENIPEQNGVTEQSKPVDEQPIRKPKDDTDEFPEEVVHTLRTTGQFTAPSTENEAPTLSETVRQVRQSAPRVYTPVTIPPRSSQPPTSTANSAKDPFSATQPGGLRRNNHYRKRGAVAASIFAVAVLSPSVLSAFSSDVSNNPGVEHLIQGETPITEPTEQPQTLGELGQDSEQLLSPLPAASPTAVAPVRFVVPNTLSVGDDNGCLELARPVVTSAVYAHDNTTETPDSGPSYIKAFVGDKQYYMELPSGGVSHVIGACGLNGARAEADVTGVSSKNVEQQKVTIDAATFSGTGEQVTPQDAVKILPWDTAYEVVKGRGSSYCTAVTQEMPNPDCQTITTLNEEQQKKLRASALFVIGELVEQTCVDEASKDLKTAARTDIKSGVLAQGIEGVERTDVTVGFTDFNVDTYLDGDLSELAAAGLGSAEEMRAMFPGVKDALIINGCNGI